ncbi:MAG TPA: SGNH/GDSL hydrolase family protein [Thermoleophilaceae bacterium]|nr:SGNH/GDSL hydrolase family protein [Thermoleophilaceae bacterium]
MVLAALSFLVAVPGVAQAATPKAKPYYLALGDSLSVGVQPTASGGNKNTSQGYANQLARRVGGLRLVNYGCGGATMSSFIKGNTSCAPKRKPGYANNSPRTSQLAAAELFLRTNRGKVRFVTIDIGANDVASCGQGGKIDIDCVNKGIAEIKKNGPTIAKRLRRAAGKGVPLAVMDLYDPFLQQWLNGGSGPVIAEASVDIARKQVNPAIVKAFRPSGFKLARVAEAFDTYVPLERTTSYQGRNDVPVAVARICALTWMCAPAPKGLDIHATKAGYAEIAAAFRKALGKAAR